jgi:hypothetical protein
MRHSTSARHNNLVDFLAVTMAAEAAAAAAYQGSLFKNDVPWLHFPLGEQPFAFAPTSIQAHTDIVTQASNQLYGIVQEADSGTVSRRKSAMDSKMLTRHTYCIVVLFCHLRMHILQQWIATSTAGHSAVATWPRIQ